MTALSKRLAKIERKLTPPSPVRWLRIVTRPGDDFDAARAAFYRDSGLAPQPDDIFINRAIIEPRPGLHHGNA